MNIVKGEKNQKHVRKSFQSIQNPRATRVCRQLRGHLENQVKGLQADTPTEKHPLEPRPACGLVLSFEEACQPQGSKASLDGGIFLAP